MGVRSIAGRTITFESRNGDSPMSRILVAVTAVFLVAGAAAPAAAQVGFRGGPKPSGFVGADADETESKPGLKAGGALTLLTIGPVSITPELFYAQKGARQNQQVEGVPVAYDFSLEYLEVPVLAKIGLPIPGVRTLRPYVAAGPAYAWKLGCEVDVDGSTQAPDCADVLGSTFSSARGAMRSADKGVVVSSGIDLNVGGLGVVNLDARLVRGLDRLNEGKSGPDLRNQSFSLMLGYSFGAGGF
jgi:hypothetical protein